MRSVRQKQELQVQVVGSSKFGIWPKISIEKTYNMFISDEWLINYAGWKALNTNVRGSQGRGLFVSIRGNFMLAVISDKVYQIFDNGGSNLVGELDTRIGGVSIDENLSAQICIVDGNNGWIYNYQDGTFTKQSMNVGFDLIPGYVVYHNSFFLVAPSLNDPNNTYVWYAFQYASQSTISHVPLSSFPLQTKPDHCLAVQRLPGKANNVLVIGSTVCEVFTQVGGTENYRRNSSFNIDAGCVSKDTIASDAQIICFLAKNEKGAPWILATDGSSVERISDDGIDNFLETIKYPDQSTGFFYRQDGHLFYQITFYNIADNVTLFYDFNTKMFFHASDQNLNYHPARQVAFFKGKNYFVSINKGVIYEFSTQIEDAFDTVGQAVGETIPRLRVSNTVRTESGKPFFCDSINIWIEQGVTSYPLMEYEQEVCTNSLITEHFGYDILDENGEILLAENGYCATGLDWPRVDLSFSKDGNQAMSNTVGVDMNPQGVYMNMMHWHRLGYANEITFQFRFWGLNRFVVKNATLEVSS